MKHFIQLFGSYFGSYQRPLRRESIELENIISSINPLSAADVSDPSVTGYADSINSASVCLDIRKNLDRMLSHSPENYESNKLLSGVGENVRYSNPSDYFALCNNSLLYSLTEYNGRLYTKTYPQNPFLEFLAGKSHDIAYPPNDSFNWRYYYKKFIGTICREYDRDHIILIRSSVGNYYCENGEFKIFDDPKLYRKRRFVYMLDRYFHENTGCVVLDDLRSTVPDVNKACVAPTFLRDGEVTERIAGHIAYIVNSGVPAEKFANPYHNDYAAYAYYRLNGSAREEFAGLLSEVEKAWPEDSESFSECIKGSPLEELAFFFEPDAYLMLFDRFYDRGSRQYKPLDGGISVIEKYTRYINCDIDDIITIYNLYIRSEDKAQFRQTARQILSQTDHIPVSAANDIRSRNLEYLSSYQYICSELWNPSAPDHIILQATKDSFLRISPNDRELFSLEIRQLDKAADFRQVEADGMICPISSVNSFYKDMKFYLDRAKAGKGNEPISLIFSSRGEFNDSLFMLDYRNILENEPLIIKTPSSTVDTICYKNRTDLDFLFADKVRLYSIRAGLADQICYYLFAKYLSEGSDSEYYFDDLYLYSSNTFNGLEVYKVTDEDIHDRLITNHLSPILREVCAGLSNHFVDTLYSCGYTDVIPVFANESYAKEIKKCDVVMFRPRKANIPVLKQFNFNKQYVCALYRPEFYPVDARKYISFKPFDTQVNIDLAEDIAAHDSVAIHIRRGDFVTFGYFADMDFYKESMEKLKAIPDYPNKKFYVFSDDIPWCRENISQTGIDIFPGTDIVFVDHNKGEDSYRDMQLMSLCRVIIGSNSGFVRMGALFSKTCEVFMCYNNYVLNDFKSVGRVNKYEIGPYKKEYSTANLLADKKGKR